MKRALCLTLLAGLAACQTKQPNQPVSEAELRPLPSVDAAALAATQRTDGPLGGGRRASAGISLGSSNGPVVGGASSGVEEPGTIMLDFAETDIREVAAQILGAQLHANYTIDPAVHGNVTLRTATPIARAQLAATLRVLLGQIGASLVQQDGFFRIVPNGAPGGGQAGQGNTAGFTLVALRYAHADDLAKVLQPFVANGGKLVADPGSNALLVGGDPDGRDALADLARSFDIDALAGQSYALFPVGPGEARSFATALQDALRGDGNSALARELRVVPLRRVDAVLVVASRPAAVSAARRIVDLIERQRHATLRTWHLYYLHHGRSSEVANFLQRAFTPHDVSAIASSERNASLTAPGEATTSLSSNATSGNGQGGSGFGSGSTGGVTAQPLSPPASQPTSSANDTNQTDSPQDGTGGQDQDSDRLRIIANKQNNAIAVYATADEADLLEGMLRKIDIMPQQVRVDATVAEVTLNDNLQYGTQFFFRQGGLNGALTSVFSGAANGFFVGGNNSSAQAAIAALQSVTKVRVLSSPQLLVMDGQSAKLQVGDLVPYQTSSSQSTITAGSPVIATINYRQTGVILDIQPRIGAGGLVTLDISQEVSDINTAIATSSAATPAFSDRTVRTTVAVQDGQTIGLAGMIRDNASSGNEGLPFLKDIPLLGAALGQQDNTRIRTEMLILVTPHVIHDQRDARALTEELRDTLPNAARVPDQLRGLSASGSSDPQAELRRRSGLQP